MQNVPVFGQIDGPGDRITIDDSGRVTVVGGAGGGADQTFAIPQRWLGELRAGRAPRPWGAIPVMASPPTIVAGSYQGASAAAVAAGGSGFVNNEEATLAGGTSLTPAIVRFTTSGGAVTSATVVRGGVYSVNPTNPVSIASTTGSGTGATFNLTFTARAASNISSRRAGGVADTNIRWNVVEPRSTTVGGDYVGSSKYVGTGSVLEFDTDAQYVNTHILPFNGGYMVYVDGERVQSSQFTTATSTSPFLSLAFADSRPRRISLVGVNLAISNIYVPATASVWAPIEPRRTLCGMYGDSWVHGTGAAEGTKLSDVFARATGWQVLASGVGSTGWNSTGDNAPFARVRDDLLQRTIEPDVVAFCFGYNDKDGNQTTVRENVVATLDLTLRNLSAPILVYGPWTPQGPATNLTTVATTIQNGIADCASPSRVTFCPLDGLITAANKTVYEAGGGDLDHVNAAGHTLVGWRMAQLALAALPSL